MIKVHDAPAILGGVGMVLAATVLIPIGLGVVAPLLMWLSGALLTTGVMIFALDYRCHRQTTPTILFTSGTLLLWGGCYLLLAGTGWQAWSIWGSGGVLAVAAFVFSVQARRICVLKASKAANPNTI